MMTSRDVDPCSAAAEEWAYEALDLALAGSVDLAGLSWLDFGPLPGDCDPWIEPGFAERMIQLLGWIPEERDDEVLDAAAHLSEPVSPTCMRRMGVITRGRRKYRNIDVYRLIGESAEAQRDAKLRDKEAGAVSAAF